MNRWFCCLVLGLLGSASLVQAHPTERTPKTAAERGRMALLEKAVTPAVVSEKTFDRLWKMWGIAEKPSNYQQALLERYGLHPAPYENRDFPMGFQSKQTLLGKRIAFDCLLCHGGAVAGNSYIGLGNASLDLQAFFDDSFTAMGLKKNLIPFPVSNVRGTIEAAAIAKYSLALYNRDRKDVLKIKPNFRADLCEDIPAWWLLKKKKTMYFNGSMDARSVRSLMVFLADPLNSMDYIKSLEPAFADLRAYMLTLEAPRYPGPVNERLADRGKALFVKNCAKCHGTYGPNWTYPNKIISLDAIGTDPALARDLSASVAGYQSDQDWFNQERGPDGTTYQLVKRLGYQAPPLDGVWATAPYFHNASAPTIYHVLNSKARPQIFTRSYRTGGEDFDWVKLGWKIRVLDCPIDANKLSPLELRKIYDTTKPGRSNGGHTFGDRLTDDERFAVIEYLKTL